MAFENLGKLKIHLGAGGTIESADNGRDALMVLITEVEKLRGELEAQKLEIEDLAARLLGK
jgi:hypothetical protein